MPSYAVRVRGLLLPKPLAGHPALELCNTLAGWDDPPSSRREWLTSYEHLAAWTEFAGLLDPCPRGESQAVLAEIRVLREVAYRLLRYRDQTAFPALAVLANEANALRRLTSEGGVATFHLPPGGDLRMPVYAAALAVVDLLSVSAAVRACPGDGCGWLFLDPRGRRVGAAWRCAGIGRRFVRMLLGSVASGCAWSCWGGCVWFCWGVVALLVPLGWLRSWR
jgi:predicted RNA-binding Zn ribbon-like protein